jgi:hypothetical protein
VALSDELEQIAASAEALAAPGERVAAILAAEPLDVGRVYLCAYESPAGRTWLALDGAGTPVDERRVVRDAASLAGLCETAEEIAGGGDVDGLIARLTEIREMDAPEGIEKAEAAARELAGALAPAPRVASPAYLDRIGAATRRLELALGEGAGSPFATAMEQAVSAVEALAAEIERTYKGPLA